MNELRPVGIRGTGAYVPEKILTNAEVSTMVDTSDEWITSRTGIRERRIAAKGETTSQMATIAARRALDDAGLTPADIGMIIVATVSGDYVFPSVGCLVQEQLGAPQVGAFDVSAACSGFVYALTTAKQFVACGTADNILVIGVESLSRITNYKDRGSCILFGDGAGAMIVSSQFERGELLSTALYSMGSGFDVIYIPSGGTLSPASHESVDNEEHTMRLRGREVYKFAVGRMVDLVNDARAQHPELTLGYVVPHQVNLRIIESARERLKIPEEQVFVNIDRYGNTSAASIAIAFDEVRRGGQLVGKEGELVVVCAFGAGLTWGSVALKW